MDFELEALAFSSAEENSQDSIKSDSSSSDQNDAMATQSQDSETHESFDIDKNTLLSESARPPSVNIMVTINEADRSICDEKFVAGSEVKVNGSTASRLPKILSGKPKAFTIEKCIVSNSAKSTKAPRGTKAVRGRGRRPALVTTYQSQITDNTLGIKLKLKKSSLATPIKENNRKKANTTGSSPSATTLKTNRKRSRKTKHDSDSDDSDYERRRRKESGVNNNSTSDKLKNRKSAANKQQQDGHEEPAEQSVWGHSIPEEILCQIFEHAINLDGCLPTIVNVGKVCSLWRRVSLTPKLWYSLDLSTWVKDRNELILKWIIENRLHGLCVDLNLGKSALKKKNNRISYYLTSL